MLESGKKKIRMRHETLRKICDKLDLDFPKRLAILKPEIADVLVISEQKTKYGSLALNQEEIRWVRALRLLPKDVQERLIKQAEVEKKMLDETNENAP